jgi:hypothetical protein
VTLHLEQGPDRAPCHWLQRLVRRVRSSAESSTGAVWFQEARRDIERSTSFCHSRNHRIPQHLTSTLDFSHPLLAEIMEEGLAVDTIDLGQCRSSALLPLQVFKPAFCLQNANAAVDAVAGQKRQRQCCQYSILRLHIMLLDEASDCRRTKS